MSSVSANRQWQRANEIANFALELAPSTHQALARLFEPLGREGESPPSWALTQELISRLASSLGGRLIQHDDAFAKVQLEERKRREYREAVANLLRDRLANARDLFRRLYGVGKGITLVGLDTNLRRVNPLQVARIGRQLVLTLREPGFEFPAVDPSLVLPTPLAYAALIEEALLPVENALAEDSPAKVEVRAAQGQRDQVLAEARSGVQRSLDFMVALYRLADMDFHADRLRMATRLRRAPPGDETDNGKKAAEVDPPVTSPPAHDPVSVPDAPTGNRTRIRRRRQRRAPFLRLSR